MAYGLRRLSDSLLSSFFVCKKVRKIESVCLPALPRRSPHEKKAEHREKARVFESIFRSDIILDTAAVSKCQLIYEGI